MQTKLLMTCSAFVMGAIGLAFTFAPDEMLVLCGLSAGGFAQLLAQVTGALYFGFAMINWMVRDNLFGGIYGRPVVIGNLVHFVMVALVLVKAILRGERGGIELVALGLYIIFAVWFGLILLRHPQTNAKN